MLTANQASLETDLTGWVNNGNAFLARSVADAADGVASLQLTAAGAGDMSAVTSPSTGIPCDPSTVYTAVARFKAATVARNVRVILNWRTAADASISSTIGAAFPDVTTGYSLAWVTGASPANAAFVRVLVQADAVGAAEVHRVDTISLVPGAVNLLTEDQASSEAALAYTAVAGTVARTVPGDYGGLLPKQGGSMLAITGTATPQNSYGRQTTPTPAIPATNYTIVASFRTVAPYGVPRSVRLNARWLDAASAQISEPASGQVFDSDTGWTQVVWQVTSPALTASVQVEPQIMGQSNGEVHFVEALAVIPGWFTDYVPPLAWTPGGFTPSQRIYVERSADAGVTWAAVKRLVPTAAQSVDADGGANVYDQTQNGTFYDYEAPPRTALLYRASASATVAALVLASGKSATSSVQHVPVSGWLKDPLYPALDRAFRFIGEMHLRPREPQGEFDGIGLTQPVTATEGWKGYEGSLDVQLDSKADHDAFLALASTGRVLLLVDPALPLQWYVKLASGIDLGRLRAADPSATYPVRHLHRVTVPFRTAAAPA
jgi:hypothetical protein